ncbi:MAG: M1 family peptidase [Actinomycetia bacterium]|nr:M1 family peptidase [Actinomycetes bacterium]
MSGHTSHRLPRNVLPTRYDIEIEPDITNSRFAGSITIRVDVAETTSSISLNAVDIDVVDVEVSHNSQPVSVTSIDRDESAELITIELASPIEGGSAEISMRFAGILNDKLRGFYRSSYTDTAGVTRTLATTQFESTSARLAFPCFDDPDLKAVFGISLIVTDGLSAISCGPQSSEELLEDGRRRLRFVDTMPIPTYVVAFVVGELEMTEPVIVRGIPIRVVHVPGKGALTDFAIEAARFSVEWLEDYFAIPIPVDKLDLVAVPDFAFGAMENHGCLTFRENLLLTNPADSTTAELTRVADVVAHEIAHMWFGNLVTMSWWEGIWLKEAFATFMEMATVAAFNPEWNRWDQFACERSNAFTVDSLAATRPIEFPVHSPSDAEAMFDVLTYEKGAAVVRMLEQHLGEDAFRDGVRHYLSKFSLGNTQTTDLWDALEESTGAPVRSTMDSWILQGGYPVIDVAATDTGVKLEQSIFRFAGSNDATWSVPLCLRAEVNGDVITKSVLLTDRSDSIDLGGRPRWVIANCGANGFYRVRYEAELAAELVREAQEIMTVAERVALVDDLVASVRAGHSEAIAIVALAEEFAHETDLSVWRSLAAGLELCDRLLHSIDDEPAMDRFTHRSGRILTPALDVLGTEPAPGEDPATSQLRGVLLRLAGSIGGDRRSIALARQIVDADVSSANSGHDPELVSAAIEVVASRADDDDFATFVERFRAATTPQTELRYLMSLARFPEPDHMKATMHMCASEVRSQNAPFLLGRCLAHPRHATLVWDFISARWDELTERFPDNSIPRMLAGIAHLSDPELADRATDFIEANPVPQGGAMIDQHLERMRINVAMHARAAAALVRSV